jgi:hypothetical protein
MLRHLKVCQQRTCPPLVRNNEISAHLRGFDGCSCRIANNFKNQNMKSNAKILTVAFVLLLSAANVKAQVIDYLQKIDYPEELPPLGAMPPERATYFLKMPSAFGVEVLPSTEAALKMPEGKTDQAVWVEFKSAVLTTAINEQLKVRGVRIAASKESAELLLRGEVSYFSQNHPYPAKRLVLDERLDSAALLEGGSPDGSRTVARSAWDLAPAYKFRNADPLTFGVGVFAALFDATGLSSALAKARNDDEKMKNESYLMVDCFDKTTRKASSCPSEAQRLDSYRRKIRLQAVDMKAYFGAPGASSADTQRVRIISRQLDSRSAAEVSLAQLLGANVNALVQGLGDIQPLKE